MKPFLLLATRADDRAAQEEHAAFARFAGLPEGRLYRHRLEQRPLGDVDPAAYAGIILGGSPFTVSDPPEQKSPVQVRVEDDLAGFLPRVLEREVPFLGACYGIGILGRALGAVVDSTYGEPVGATEVVLTAAGRADPLLSAVPDRFEAFVGHKEAITAPTPEMTVLAGSAACPVQAFRVGRRAWATQFHPELDVPGIQTRIEVYKHAGYFPAEEAEDLKTRAAASGVSHPPALVRRFVALCEDWEQRSED